jgi:hypothetical protein
MPTAESVTNGLKPGDAHKQEIPETKDWMAESTWGEMVGGPDID